MFLHDAPHWTFLAAVENEQDAHSQTNQNADKQVRQDDRHNGDHKGKKLMSALPPHLFEQRRAGQFKTCDNQNPGESGQGNLIEPGRNEKHTEEKEDAMKDGAQFGPASRIDIHRASNNDAGQGESADQTTRNISKTLSHQLAIGRSLPLVRVDLVHGFEIQERLERCHDRDGDGAGKDRRITDEGEIWEAQEAEECGEVLGHRDLHEVTRFHCPTACSSL